MLGREMNAYLPVKDHLVAFPVFDLAVEVLRQLQAFINLSLEADGALAKNKIKHANEHNWTHGDKDKWMPLWDEPH